MVALPLKSYINGMVSRTYERGFLWLTWNKLNTEIFRLCARYRNVE
jgi:hypothetical protein